MKLTTWEPDLRTLYSWIENGEIDLQPNFQRGDVWPTQKKKRLIDTIIREWSIPPVHMVVTNSGALQVLDGQQRLTAIRDYMNGEFAIDGSIEPWDDRTAALANLKYSQLPVAARRSFDQYTIRVLRITEYQPDEPGELFYRLNQQITLTAGEQRNAIFGPAREQLKEIVASFEKKGNARETIGFSNSRLAYDDVFAKLLFFVELETFAEKATEARISDRFKRQSAFSPQIIYRTKQAIIQFSDSRNVASKIKLNKASLLSWLLFYCRFDRERAPVEFLGMFEGAKDFRHDEALLPADIAAPGFRALKSSTYFERSALSLFVDRSSLRVSDVSSVVYRDFALWSLYLRGGFAPVPSSIDRGSVDQVAALLKERDDSGLETCLDILLNPSRWARF